MIKKEIRNFGLPPLAIDYISTLVKDEEPYVIWYLIPEYPIPLYRYLSADETAVFESIESLVELEDTIEIYLSVVSNMVVHAVELYKWGINEIFSKENDDTDINKLFLS